MKPIHLFAFLLLSILFSCEPENISETQERLNSTNLEFYPEELYEFSEQQVPVPHLKFVTTEIYPCYNYEIDFSHSFKDGELTVNFKAIEAPEACLTAFGPAINYLELPLNTKKIILIRGETQDVYDVSITTERIEIEPINSSFSDIIFPNTFRYPENSFALICGTNLEDTDICNRFTNFLRESVSLSEMSFSGEARIPFPDSSSGHWKNFPSKFFLYENETDLMEATELLKTFTRENIIPNQGNSLNIITWDNRRYASWFYQE